VGSLDFGKNNGERVALPVPSHGSYWKPLDLQPTEALGHPCPASEALEGGVDNLGWKLEVFGEVAKNPLDGRFSPGHSADPELSISQGGEAMTNCVSHFDRLVASVRRIVQAPTPGFDQVLSQCLEDIDALRNSERITAEQREALRFLVLGVSMHSA